MENNQQTEPKKEEYKELLPSDLPKLYKELKAPLPREAIQEAQQKEFKGYDTIGFGYQWIVNRLNDVLGIEHWKIIEQTIVEPVKEGKMWEVTKKIILQIGNFVITERNDYYVESEQLLDKRFIVIEEPDLLTPESRRKIDYSIKTRNVTEFKILAEKEAYGGHCAKLLADAHKGAYTNGLKKAAAMFGVGREAYEATLDEDNRNIKAIYEDMMPEKQKEADRWITEIQNVKDQKELEIVGKKIKEIKSDKNLILILRGEYNKKLVSFKKIEKIEK